MEDFCMNSTSQDNIVFSYNDSRKVPFTIPVVTYTISCIGIPLTLLAIYALYSLVRNDHVTPIYVINLLISDLIQLCCMIILVSQCMDQMIYKVANYFYVYCLMTGVCFMVCVALERYLVIARPLWYHFRRTIKISVVVCLLVWAFPLVYSFTCCIYFRCWEACLVPRIFYAFSAIFFLLPLPLFIFFLGGTLKALSASRVPSDEKQRIVGIVFLVLLIYTLLFLPTIIWPLPDGDIKIKTFRKLSFILVQLNPLADLALYIFMRKGIVDQLLASVRCCRMDDNDSGSSTV